MIEKEKFITLIKEYQNFDKQVQDLSDITKMFWFDLPLVEYSQKLFNHILKICFNDFAIDMITWWLFERDSENPNPQMFDKDDKPIPTNTIEDLWEIVRTARNSKLKSS